MKLLTLILTCFTIYSFGQSAPGYSIPQESMLAKLNDGDSLVYYQCHVEEAVQQMTTVSGQTLTGAQQKYSITEKFVVKKSGETFAARYYISSLNILPNRKFSGLKIREKDYWNFKFEKEINLTENHVKAIVALERKGREANEYDFVINKYTTNELIIKKQKDFKQLVITGTYLLSKILSN